MTYIKTRRSVHDVLLLDIVYVQSRVLPSGRPTRLQMPPSGASACGRGCAACSRRHFYDPHPTEPYNSRCLQVINISWAD